MCIAIYSIKGNDVPSHEILETCWENNPDGAGFAFNDKGQVKIVKGFMTYAAFIATFKEYEKKYDFKNRGVLIHFRITTHGGTCKECCHPFPIVADEGILQKPEVISPYAAIHNGIISLTSTEATKRTKMSDTMVFIEKYLTKIASNKNWFNNKSNFELIDDLIDSKMAVLNGDGDIMCTSGFDKDEKDGNFYSNTSYKWPRYSYKKYYGSYDWDSPYYGTGYNYGKSENKSLPASSTNSDKKKYVSVPMMRFKPGQTLYYEDGTVEPFDYAYHEDYPCFIDEFGNVYGVYDDEPIYSYIKYDRLTLIGEGAYVLDSYNLTSEDGFNLVDFEKDITVWGWSGDDDGWFDLYLEFSEEMDPKYKNLVADEKESEMTQLYDEYESLQDKMRFD